MAGFSEHRTLHAVRPEAHLWRFFTSGGSMSLKQADAVLVLTALLEAESHCVLAPRHSRQKSRAALTKNVPAQIKCLVVAPVRQPAVQAINAQILHTR
jgi:hypothetical protein